MRVRGRQLLGERRPSVIDASAMNVSSSAIAQGMMPDATWLAGGGRDAGRQLALVDAADARRPIARAAATSAITALP